MNPAAPIKLIIVSDIHYAGAAERARGNDYELKAIRKPFTRLVAGLYRHYVWMRHPMDRGLLLEELEVALSELPQEQRAVFVAHELEGISFKELSEATGVNVNTLLSRKRYAVLQLRQRLQKIHDEFTKK